MSDDPDPSPNLPSDDHGVVSERQHAAIALLVSGKTYTATADAIGVDRRTLWEWRQQSEFIRALNAELDEVRTEARLRITSLAHRAVDTIEHVMEHGYTDTEKLAAVRLVLNALDRDAAIRGQAIDIAEAAGRSKG